MGDETAHRRRCRLAELIFEEYATRLPNGEAMGSKETWPEGWVDRIAETPPMCDLDRYIVRGALLLQAGAAAAWQAGTS